MKNYKFLNILLLSLAGVFYIVGSKFGALFNYAGSLSLIAWATLFVGANKKINKNDIPRLIK